MPDGALCILPGDGRTVGKELIDDRRIKKIDLTVRRARLPSRWQASRLTDS